MQCEITRMNKVTLCTTIVICTWINYFSVDYKGRMKSCVVVCSILLLTILAFGQQDSTNVELQILNAQDIDQIEISQKKLEIFTGLRTEANLEDLPITIQVITKEEIKENGFQTLTEALRSLPGIRTSQSGNVFDGENFMMRGHYGNTYAKILINDIPIRPSVVGTMPLASQLPIKQAERIEVIYGPSATLYGSDAAAGIINIILKENDYPSYATANIETGDENLARVNVSFGGKYKVGNKALDINLMGGFTSFSDRKIKYDINNLYNINNYTDVIGLADIGGINLEDRPNFSSTNQIPLNNLPHQSNYIGFYATLGGFDIITQRFSRSDHSTLGLNPLSVSYANSQQSFGEEIISTAANYQKEYDKWKWRLTLNSIIYNVNQNSSFNYVLPTFGIVSNAYAASSIGSQNLDPNIDAASSIDSVYFSGPRFTSGNFNDFSLEYKSFIQLNSYINLSVGIGLEGGVGRGIEQFLTTPKEIARIFDIPTVIENPGASFGAYNGFAELFYRKGSLSVIAGSHIYRRADRLEQNRAVFSPRLGILYKLKENMSLRAFYSEAFRYPSTFYGNNSFTISSTSTELDVAGGSLGLQPETTNNIEFGLRWTLNKYISLDATIFQTRTSNFINFEIRQTPGTENVFWGYANSADSFTKLRGIQASITLQNLFPQLDMKSDISISYTKGEERLLELLLTGNNDRFLVDVPVVRGQPDFVFYMNNKIKLIKDLSLVLQHSIVSNSWTRNTFRISQGINEQDLTNVINPGYYILDARLMFDINRQLDCYVNISNVLNQEYAGIDATVDLDGLLYNPQQTRFISFGVNFSFN